MLTDACNTTWTGIVTQVPTEDLDKPHQDQNYRPLGFLSDRLSKAQLGRSASKKKAYAITATVTRMHCLTAIHDGFNLYKDHNNLLFLFDTLAVATDLSETSVCKMLRWAVHLSSYNYICYRISGTDNVWANILGRWNTEELSSPSINRRVMVPPYPSTNVEDFEWPSTSALLQVQSTTIDSIPHNAEQEDGLRILHKKLWIPDDVVDLQLCICIIAHCGAAEHRGQEATPSAIWDKSFWSSTIEVFQLFVRSSTNCLSSSGGS